MRNNFDYSIFSSRNYMYIPSDIQEKIKNSKISFFGTGLSSQIALAATRVGFTSMNLMDGDKVDHSNLNRQAFDLCDIGTYKAESLKKRILAINPLASISVKTEFVKKTSDIETLIKESDIIVNTIDCNQIYFDLIELGRSYKKLVICPFNPGFSGFTLNFTEDSSSSHELFDMRGELNDVEIAKQLFERFPKLRTLSHARSSSDEFLRNAVSLYFPQIIVGALITSGIVISTMIHYLSGHAFIKAPNACCLDGHNELELQ